MKAVDVENISERYDLCIERIRQIAGEEVLKQPLLSYFRKVSDFVVELSVILERSMSAEKVSADEITLAEENRRIYSDICGAAYENSYANPDYITRVFGEAELEDADKIAKYLCFLYTEIRGLIPYAYEGDKITFTLFIELFSEIYQICLAAAECKENVAACNLKDAIYWFESDNCDILLPLKLYRQLDPEYDFAKKIIEENDLNNTRYLYLYGEYISEDELEASKYIASLDDDVIQLMADTFTEGYRIGFVKAGKPLDKKTSVNIRYTLGFERVTRRAIENFKKMGLEANIYRAATLSIDKRGQLKIGYTGGCANRQYDYDHKDDEAVYLDADFVTRKVDVLKESFESMKSLANGHAGPACQEVFGEKPFEPVTKASCITYDDRTRKLSVDLNARTSQVTNEYIIGSERSFTIIDYPTPSIGDKYKEIFGKTIELNTLDYHMYESMQQILIDILDKAEYVHVTGRDGNRTDITVALHTKDDPLTETVFENCVADVNIPVGEVFTSPRLKGTNGTLHVKEVYLNELLYKNFELKVEDGVVAEYSCTNFEDEKSVKKYIKDNFLYGHKTLPMGEFAIGTNTVAYKMARDYAIEGRLPILIGEKTGPHFAFGDTCYSHEEDVEVYNPDGKRMIAKENEISAKRNEDIKAAYFQCHTDVTIPYDELGTITAIGKDGEYVIFADGKFVPEGLDELNKPLKQ